MCCPSCLRLIVLAALAVLAPACGPSGQSARDKVIHASYAMVEGARAEFVVWDFEHQRQLVASSQDPITQRAAVMEWRATKRTQIVETFEMAYAALAAAAIASDDQSATALAEAVKILLDELHSMGVLK